MKKPVLIIVAGPNGSGKTTITQKLLTHPWLKSAVRINPDDIAQEKFGRWNNKESFIKAANCAEEKRNECIKNKQRLFFITTLQPIINVKRVEIRVGRGGHTAPKDKIITRYYKSILNCIKIINLVDRIYLYGNSIDNQDPKIMLGIKNVAEKNRAIKKYENLPDWTLGIAYCYNLVLEG